MNAYKTAKSRIKVSKPTEFLHRMAFVYGKTLDYGCGKGMDTKYLLEQGVNVFGYDPHYQPELSETSFDTIICNYVVNVIDDFNVRIDLFRKAFDLLAPGGKMYITARNTKEINYESNKGNWQRYNDGFLTKRGTFQKGIDFVDMMGYYALSGISKNSTYNQILSDLKHTTIIVVSKNKI